MYHENNCIKYFVLVQGFEPWTPRVRKCGALSQDSEPSTIEFLVLR